MHIGFAAFPLQLKQIATFWWNDIFGTIHATEWFILPIYFSRCLKHGVLISRGIYQILILNSIIASGQQGQSLIVLRNVERKIAQLT